MDGSFYNYKTVAALLIKGFVVTALFGMCVYQTNSGNTLTAVKNVCFIAATFCTLFILCDAVLKLCNVLWQVWLCDTDSNLAAIMDSAFKFDWKYVGFVTCVVLIFLIAFIKEGPTLEFIWRFPPILTVLCSLLAWMLVKIATEPTLPRNASIESMEGLDYGTGMAHSYYYGYLKIILPSNGTIVKGLIEKMENIEDSHNITFAVRKLIILVPSSSYIPPDLREASDNWMESAVDLEAEERDRAGVKRRVYRNNVYKIYPEGRRCNNTPVFVVAEGATPLLTFYEVLKHSHPETELYKRHRVEIVRAFYTKLRELLDSDPECRDICELIYYNDYHDDRKRVNVAKVILDRILSNRTTNGFD